MDIKPSFKVNEEYATHGILSTGLSEQNCLFLHFLYKELHPLSEKMLSTSPWNARMGFSSWNAAE